MPLMAQLLSGSRPLASTSLPVCLSLLALFTAQLSIKTASAIAVDFNRQDQNAGAASPVARAAGRTPANVHPKATIKQPSSRYPGRHKYAKRRALAEAEIDSHIDAYDEYGKHHPHVKHWRLRHQRKWRRQSRHRLEISIPIVDTGVCESMLTLGGQQAFAS
jgi:hypothetical protein